ncbi:MAG: nucleoside-diphosphate sugar epimerase/dehydratase [Erysipelotrichaceae bacterium]|nr:nucleoside-diphosphate sugar epimerase/dehydratase [Erysipelotrichaceae bacterium]
MKKYRNVLLSIFDIVMVIVAYFVALWIRLDFSLRSIAYFHHLVELLPVIVIAYFIAFKLAKIDKTLWTSPSVDEALRVSMASLLGFAIVFVFCEYVTPVQLPLSVHFIALMLVVLSMIFVRFSYRIYRLLSSLSGNNSEHCKRTLIVGAGEAGTMLLKEILQNKKYNNKVIGFLDDDAYKIGKLVMGIPVLAKSEEVGTLAIKENIDVIYIAMPSVSVKKQNEIAKLCYGSQAKVYMLTGSQDMIQAAGIHRSIREMSIEDLLGRKEVHLKHEDLKELIHDKSILVTGAGGSIGSELVRQIVLYQPKSVIMLDISENSIYDLQSELNIWRKEKKIAKDVEFLPIIGSIRDIAVLDMIFERSKFDLVFHAAAHKHVPLMESMPAEAVKNNIFGSHHIIELCKKHKVKQMVHISTDKAVNPTNVMGATKRFVEKMIQTIGKDGPTKFVAVRFGNVLGSSGSVIPLFKKQIASGGPVTVTDPEMIRYFMTITEAVSLILQAASYGEGGEIFVLDMGEPVKILDLAEKMISLAGYVPYQDIDIEFTGLRPGEKLFEELLMGEEGLKETPNPLIKVTKPMEISREQIIREIEYLRKVVAVDQSRGEIIKALMETVPTYRQS